MIQNQQRLNLSEQEIAEWLDRLKNEVELCHQHHQQFRSDVQLRDSVLSQLQYGMGLLRRSQLCLARATETLDS